MPSHKICLTLVSPAPPHRIAALLQELIEPAPEAVTLFETPGYETRASSWDMEAYFAAPPDVQAIRAALGAVLEEPIPAIHGLTVPDCNWVALSQAALPRVKAGRFTIHGSHERRRVAKGRYAILIEAGEAFGTAHHATTFACLLAIDRLTLCKTYNNILDLGCGSAVLAIALARALPGARITAADNDPKSVAVARSNIRANGAENRITVRESQGLRAAELRAAAAFDLIVANILASPLRDLASSIAASTLSGGTIVLSGVLDHQAAPIIATYVAHGFTLSGRMSLAGWSTLILTRRNIVPLRRPA